MGMESNFHLNKNIGNLWDSHAHRVSRRKVKKIFMKNIKVMTFAPLYVNLNFNNQNYPSMLCSCSRKMSKL